MSEPALPHSAAADQGRRLFGWSLFGFLLALTLLKGLRMPSRWAVTHYLFTYQTGFMKRALWGEVLSGTLGSWTARYFCLATVALLVLAALIVLLVRLGRQIPDVSVRVPFLLVFFASPALSFAAHTVGYLDQLAYLGLIIVAVQRRSWAVQVAAALAAAAALPLVHEASVLWVGALTGLVVVAGGAAGRQPVRSRLIALTALAAVWLAATAMVGTYGSVRSDRATAMAEDRTAFFDIRPRQDAFRTLTVPLAASYADTRARWSERNTRMEMLFSLLVFGPAAIVLGSIALGRIRPQGQSRPMKLLTAGLVVGAIASPLVLHVVGWDLHRWNALAALNAGLAALILLIALPPPSPPVPELRTGRASPAALGVALAVCLWGLSADPIFFDDYRPEHPPFMSRIHFLIQAVQSGDPNAWIPLVGN